MALNRAARLYTFNLKHFRVGPGLDVQEPYSRAALGLGGLGAGTVEVLAGAKVQLAGRVWMLEPARLP